jgi:hypothetical protein
VFICVPKPKKIGGGLADLKEKIDEILDGQPCRRNDIDFWDGKTASRIVENIKESLTAPLLAS